MLGAYSNDGSKVLKYNWVDEVSMLYIAANRYRLLMQVKYLFVTQYFKILNKVSLKITIK